MVLFSQIEALQNSLDHEDWEAVVRRLIDLAKAVVDTIPEGEHRDSAIEAITDLGHFEPLGD